MKQSDVKHIEAERKVWIVEKLQMSFGERQTYKPTLVEHMEEGIFLANRPHGPYQKILRKLGTEQRFPIPLHYTKDHSFKKKGFL